MYSKISLKRNLGISQTCRKRALYTGPRI